MMSCASGNSRRLSIKFMCVTLPYMSISAGVVRAIALQQIDHAPHAKASAEGNHKGLQSGDGRSEKLHIFLRFSGVKAPAMKKAALAGGSLLPWDEMSQSSIQKRPGRRGRHS